MTSWIDPYLGSIDQMFKAGASKETVIDVIHQAWGTYVPKERIRARINHLWRHPRGKRYTMWDGYGFPETIVDEQVKWELGQRILNAVEAGASTADIAKHLSFSRAYIHYLIARARTGRGVDRKRLDAPVVNFLGAGPTVAELRRGLQKSMEIAGKVERDWLSLSSPTRPR